MDILDKIVNPIEGLFQNEYEKASETFNTGNLVEAHPALLAALNPQQPISTLDIRNDKDMDPSALDEIKSALAYNGFNYQQATINFGVNPFFKVDGYNPMQDPMVTERGDDFIFKYGSDLLESNSPTVTQSILRTIDDNEMMKSVLDKSDSVLTSAVGFTASVLSDPTIAIPLIGQIKKGISIANIASGAGQAALGAIAGEGLRQGVDPTRTAEESAYTVVMSAALGGLMLGVGGALSAKEAGEMATNLKGIIDPVDDIASGADAIKLVQESTAGAKATDFDLSGWGIANTNWAFEKLSTGLKQIAPELRMLKSKLPLSQKWASELYGHAYTLERNLQGKAGTIDIQSRASVRAGHVMKYLDDALKQAEIVHAKSGGKLTPSQLDALAKQYITLNKTFDVPGLDIAAKAYKKVFKDLEPTVRDLMDRPDEFVAKGNYFHRQLDYNKLVKNPNQLLRDITEELRPSHVNNLDELDLDAQVVLDEFVHKSLGKKFVTPKFEAKGLKSRTNNFSEDFWIKYGTDDIRGSVNKYINDTILQHELSKTFGKGDVYQNIEKSLKDNLTKAVDKVNADDTLSQAAKDKAIAELDMQYREDLSDVVTSVDIMTGKQNADVSLNVRNGVAIAKSMMYLLRMGKNVLSQFNDAAKLLTTKMFPDTAFHKELTQFGSDLSKTFKTMKAGEAKDISRKILLLSEEIRTDGFKLKGMLDPRLSMMTELQPGAFLTGTEKIMQTATAAYSKATLTAQWTDLLRTTAFENIVDNIVKLSAKRIAGGLDDASEGMIELSKLGFNQYDIEKIVNNFNTHKIVESTSGGNVVFSGIRNWDPEIQSKIFASARKQVDLYIMAPSIGSKPFFMSNSMWSVITQFKSFMTASLSRSILPAMQQLKGIGQANSRRAAAFLTADIASAAMIGVVKELAKGNEVEVDSKPEIMVQYILDNSAFLSPISMVSGILDQKNLGIGSALGTRNKGRAFNQSMIESLAGPSAGYIEDLFDAPSYYNDGTITDSEMKKLIRLAPFNNYLLWDWYINQLNK